jgi:hypothetical protein
MSDINRSRMIPLHIADQAVAACDAEIAKLREENARLKAEVERLEHQVNYWRIEAEVDNARWLRCLQDIEELRASSFVTAVPCEQYDRVIKAGDAMASSIQFNEEMSQDYNGPTIVHQSVQRWNAAKEGKGQS